MPTIDNHAGEIDAETVQRRLAQSWELANRLDDIGNLLRRRATLAMLAIAALVGALIATMFATPPDGLEAAGRAIARTLTPSVLIGLIAIAVYFARDLWQAPAPLYLGKRRVGFLRHGAYPVRLNRLINATQTNRA